MRIERMEFFQGKIVWLKLEMTTGNKFNLFLRNPHNPQLFWFHEGF
jgi:hypothetical protein